MCGFVCVTYDNVGFFSNNSDRLILAAQHLRRNCKLFSIVLKEDTLYYHKNMLRENPNNQKPVHLGIEFAYVNSRPRQIVWRLNEKVVNEWRCWGTGFFSGEPMTPRKMAQFYGRIIRHQYLLLQNQPAFGHFHAFMAIPLSPP